MRIMGYQNLLWMIAFTLSIFSVESQLDDLEQVSPRPYSFGYKVQDGDGDQWRSEVSDGAGTVRGTYGFIDADGMHRHVDYEADGGGFRARIRTNEPGMDVPDPANVVYSSPGNDFDGAAAPDGVDFDGAATPDGVDADVYGVETVLPEPPLSSNAIEPSQKLYRYSPDPSGPQPPPVYVVNGHLQSPWFPMDTVAIV